MHAHISYYTGCNWSILNVLSGTFFLVYPGSDFEMLFITKELMILIVVKKEQEYKVQAVL